uniref:Uncharacterized protein n=1 Tax=Tetraselmis sp. GSL018 TaxID=582737 RepID=A0A061REV4_9CHLO
MSSPMWFVTGYLEALIKKNHLTCIELSSVTFLIKHMSLHFNSLWRLCFYCATS